MKSPELRSPVLLRARGIARRQPESGRWLLVPTDLELAAGERLALVGPTGSGKTLVLRALALLDPVDEGEVQWRDAPIADDQVPRFRSRVLYLQQSPSMIEGTVEDNLRLPFRLRCRSATAYPAELATELLEAVGRAADFLSADAANLSGGERQLVALIRALLVEPIVLLLDEPSAALDRETAGGLERLVDGWYRAAPGERAWIWVSHDPSQTERLADRTIRLQGGR